MYNVFSTFHIKVLHETPMLLTIKKAVTKLRISIRMTVVTVFVLATSLTAFIALSLQYHFSEQMILDSSLKHFNMTNQTVTDYLSEINHNSENALRILVLNSSLVETDFTDNKEMHDIMSEVMLLNPLFFSMYVATDEGEFYDVINLDSGTTPRKQLRALANDRWVVVHVYDNKGQRIEDTYYYDGQFNLRVMLSDKTRFDPRERIWFKNATTQKVSKTQPYFFNYLQAPGQTYSIRSKSGKNVLALDVSLSSISEYLITQQNKIIDNAQAEIFIYKRNGEVIASNNSQQTIELPSLNKLTLSTEQQSIVARYPYITVSNETNWPPMDFSVGGQPKGYSIDFINSVAKLLGLKVTYVNGFSWHEFVEQFKNQKIDIIQPVFNTEKNESLGLLSHSITSLPLSIITKPKVKAINDINQLAGKTLAIGKGWAIKEPIVEHFPNVKIIEADSTKKILELVKKGEVFAGIDNEMVFKYTQKQFFIEGVKYHYLQKAELAMLPNTMHLLFHSEDEKLKELIDYAIKRLPESYIATLKSKWLSDDLQARSQNIGVVPYAELINSLENKAYLAELKLVNINDEEKYIFINSLGASKDSDFLAIIVPKDSLLSLAREKIKVSIVITALCLLMLLPVSWFFASPIVRPIKNLADETLRIQRREFDQVTTLKSNIKEINNLASSMVDMSKSIEQHELSQKALIDSFIELIAQAIDDKSPYTAGHCERVPELGIMLAKEASNSDAPAFKAFSFKSKDEFREFSLAAWLHDCGKIITPEHIVDKGTKLETIYNRIHEIRTRFEVLWRDAEIAYYQGAINNPDHKDALKKQMHEQHQQLHDDFNFIALCNVGGEFLSDERIARLETLSQVTWTRHFSDKLGLSPLEELKYKDLTEQLPTTEYLLSDKPEHLIPHQKPIEYEPHLGIKIAIPEYKYNLGELYNLKIKRGTLTSEDRFKINEHIISTIRMLDNLPFPDELSKVPRYASTHHETLNGKGYPRKLTGDDLSIPERVLVLADIFEALTAADRPYKKAKSLSTSIDILAKMVADQHVDKDVFELFLTSGLYLTYAERYLEKEQIDEVDIQKYLS